MRLFYNLQLNETGQWGKSHKAEQQQRELDLAMLRNGEASTFKDLKDYFDYLGGVC
jgi:hypothetical protein